MAISSNAIILSMHDGSDYTAIAEVLDVSGPALDQAIAAVTNHNSNRNTQSISTLKGGQIDFDINFIPTETTHADTSGLLNALNSGDAKLFKLTFPNGYQWLFNSIVLGFDPVENVDGELSATLNMLMTGIAQFNEVTGFPYVFPYILS